MSNNSTTDWTKSELGAIATSQGFTKRLWVETLRLRSSSVAVLAGRYHHPTRAARAGTPVAPSSDFAWPTLNLCLVDIAFRYKLNRD